jgi:hypothetical protein
MENIETEETTETEKVFNYPDGSVFYREILTDGNIQKLGMPTKDPKIAEMYGYLDQYVNETDLTYVGDENSGIYYIKGHEPAEETRDEMIARRQAEIVNMVQNLIDETAQQKRYDDGLSCVSYVGDPDEEFNADAVAFQSWRGHCWRTCYNILNSVKAGTVAPEDVTDQYVIERLPVMEWPEV